MQFTSCLLITNLSVRLGSSHCRISFSDRHSVIHSSNAPFTVCLTKRYTLRKMYDEAANAHQTICNSSRQGSF